MHLIPNYMRALNDLTREELGWRSPFEIYYGRVSNFIKKDNIEEDGIIYQQDIDFRLPDSATISKALEHAEKIRHDAAKCGKKMDERMIRKDKRKCRNDVFTMKEMVLVRLGSKRSGKGGPKRRYVVKGKMLKISCWSENYKLLVIRPGETTPTETWTSIENIAKIKSNPKDNKKPSRS